MRFVARCVVLVCVLCCALPVARGNVVNFNVVSEQSEVSVNIILDTPLGSDTDSDTTSVTGNVTANVESPSMPFGEFQITDFTVSTAQATSLNFCFVQIISCLAGVNVTSAAGDMSAQMVLPGPPTTIMGTAFTQINNDIQLAGTINVDATGLASGQVPEGPFLINSDPLPNDLTGTLTRVGNTLTLTLDLVADGTMNDPDTGVMTDFMMSGTIVATAELNVNAPGDLNCSGSVDVADVPLFVEALLSPGTFGGCDISLADVNGDTLTDGRDIGGFVAAVLGI